MTPKEYLQQVSRAEKELETLRARVRHYESLGFSITSHTSDASIRSSTPHSRVESAAVGIVDTLKDIQGKIGAYNAIVREAEKLIDQVPQDIYRRILTLRYLCGHSFPTISDEMQYKDRNSIYRAHGYALQEFGRVMRNAGKG